jgi:hypothetical protein
MLISAQEWPYELVTRQATNHVQFAPFFREKIIPFFFINGGAAAIGSGLCDSWSSSPYFHFEFLLFFHGECCLQYRIIMKSFLKYSREKSK